MESSSNQPNQDLNQAGNKTISLRWILAFEFCLVLLFTFFPLLFELPYRDNLYLSWEGTYRLYLGQMPYKDFGMPIGYGYFIIPLMFFKIFGPVLRSLLYAQVFINLMTVLLFRGILKNLGIEPALKFFSVLVFTVSYTFVFFWPWYNNTAFFFQLAGIYMLVHLTEKKSIKNLLFIIGAALFTFLSLFTKQDYGGMAFIFSFILISCIAWYQKDLKKVVIYLLAYLAIAAIFIFPLKSHGFFYWFNYGQSPHQSRLNIGHFLNEILGASGWEKFYLFIVILLALEFFKNFNAFLKNRNEWLLLLLTLGMIAEALITKVTSRLPADTATYFHGFSIAFILTRLRVQIFSRNLAWLSLTTGLVVIWWSGIYWKYANRMFHLTTEEKKVSSQLNKYKSEPWKPAPYSVYKSVNLPVSTIQGIKRIKNLDIVKQNRSNLRVLNMSELTPLAYELNYTPSMNLPLWYHLNIGMFPKQVEEISKQIKNNQYDLVLFEEVPSLDNFYPEEVRLILKNQYQQVDSFMAPRREGDSHIEVFIKK